MNLSKTERLVVYTAIAGSGRDQLCEPKAAPGVDYICFTDQPFTSAVWQIRPFTWTHAEAVRTAKYPKVLPHKYFPEHDLSLWVDGNITPGADIAQIAIYYLKNHDLAIHRHPRRSCLYQEALLVAREMKDFPELIDKTISRYLQAGVPDDIGLYECGILFRRHHAPEIQKAMELWWEEIANGTQSDQINFAYVLWQNNLKARIIDGDLRQSPFFKFIPHAEIYWGAMKALCL